MCIMFKNCSFGKNHSLKAYLTGKLDFLFHAKSILFGGLLAAKSYSNKNLTRKKSRTEKKKINK